MFAARHAHWVIARDMTSCISRSTCPSVPPSKLLRPRLRGASSIFSIFSILSRRPSILFAHFALVRCISPPTSKTLTLTLNAWRGNG